MIPTAEKSTFIPCRSGGSWSNILILFIAVLANVQGKMSDYKRIHKISKGGFTMTHKNNLHFSNRRDLGLRNLYEKVLNDEDITGMMFYFGL